jgi:D-3-phosphoglycerate dehydrogenase
VKSSLFKNITIYLADEIHRKKSGFNLVEWYGLNNDVLINNIMKNDNGSLLSALIVRSIRTIDEQIIDRLSKHSSICLICTASSGFDNIDSAFAFKKGIDVLNVPEGNFISAAEHTMTMILAAAKNILDADSDMKKGIFNAGRYTNTELLGKTIGVIGIGRVGSYVAKLSRTFGLNILGNDIDRSLVKKYKWIKFTSLTKLLQLSDIITVHTPLDKSTFNLINKENITLLKRNAILINCARGGIVNEAVLIKALKQNRLYYAGIDVFQNEPDILPEFKNVNNIIFTPHLAGKTNESKIRISEQLAERIITYFKKLKFNAKNSKLKN